MKKVKIDMFMLPIAAFCGLLLLVSSGCVKQNASKAENLESPKAEISTSADPEIAAVQKIIEKMPDSANGYNRLAAVYIKKARETGDFSLNAKAETAVDKALQFAPEDASAKKLKASLHLTFHRFGEALELGAKLQKEYPNDAFVYGVLTDANAELGNYEAAVEAAQKMVDLKPNTSSYARVAHIRALHGDTKGAIEMMGTAARTADPQDKEARSWCLVQIGDQLWKTGKYPEAERVYDEALQNFPNYHFALAGKGRARAAQNDFDSAIKFLTEANNRVPNAETIILLGDIYTKQGNAEKAKQQYDLVEVVEGKLGMTGDQKRLALFWADHDVKLDEALAITKREYDSRKDIYTADALAWNLYKKGQLNEAKTAIAAALRLKTEDARIIYHAGMIEKGLGNQKEAKRLLEKALKINPSFDLLQTETAQKALQELS
ncbi:MAG: tetratricopeptide repeat protein [Pyrinomonadaceae bacterium]|nr:tetratricopeptide repeat protein [Pyrinomonadaceae bacterium]